MLRWPTEAGCCPQAIVPLCMPKGPPDGPQPLQWYTENCAFGVAQNTMESLATPSAQVNPIPSIVVDAERTLVFDSLRELWQGRELILFLTWRDIKVRYQQTAIGFVWAILQPTLTMAIFSVIFGRFAHIPSEGVPYPIFAIAGIVPWLFFSTAVIQSSNSLINNSPLLSKIYLPRLSLPIASVLSSAVDFCLAFGLMLLIMLYHGVYPGAGIVLIPLFFFLAFCAALGTGLWLSALNVRFRDVRHAVPFMIQLWMFVSPIAYPTSLVPAKWRRIYDLNPMVGTVDGFRLGLLNAGRLSGYEVGVLFLISIVLLVTGCLYFLRVERQFADVV
jgi:lipopolysaccharide transport system permease protein